MEIGKLRSRCFQNIDGFPIWRAFLYKNLQKNFGLSQTFFRAITNIFIEGQKGITPMTNLKVLQEQILISRVKQRDRHAADKLIQRYYNEIYAYVFRQTGDKEQAMDLTQEIFLAVLQSIGRFDAKKASFRTWLYRIASHKTIDWFRGSSNQRSGEQISLNQIDVEPMEKLDLEKLVTDKAFAEQILLWLQTQDETLEVLMRLKFYGEKTFDEIAEVLSLPMSTVKTRYYAALKAARKEFRP